jgi:hypothetical protein
VGARGLGGDSWRKSFGTPPGISPGGPAFADRAQAAAPASRLPRRGSISSARRLPSRGYRLGLAPASAEVLPWRGPSPRAGACLGVRPPLRLSVGLGRVAAFAAGFRHALRYPSGYRTGWRPSLGVLSGAIAPVSTPNKRVGRPHSLWCAVECPDKKEISDNIPSPPPQTPTPRSLQRLPRRGYISSNRMAAIIGCLFVRYLPETTPNQRFGSPHRSA